MTVKSSPSYLLCHSLTQGITRRQLIQPKVQNSNSTTLPCTDAKVTGVSLLIQVSFKISGGRAQIGQIYLDRRTGGGK